MKTNNLILLVSILALTIFSACTGDDCENGIEPTPVNEPDEKPVQILPAEPISLSIEGQNGVNMQNDFAISIFKDVVADSDGENSLLSPLSLTTCVSMLANGASDEAAVEIIENLMGGGLTLERFNQNNEFLMNELSTVDPSSTFLMANSAWLNKTFSFLPSFEDNVKKFYNAKTAVLDMYSTDARDIINEWTYNTTKGLIPKLFDNAPSAKFVLANSIYFNGGWVVEFNENDTKEKAFTNIDGSISEVQTMRMEDYSFNFRIDNELSAVCLPYGNHAFNFYAFMPNENTDFISFVNSIDFEKMNRIINSMKQDYVYIDLPKFDVSTENDHLEKLLKLHGIKKVFSDKNAISKLADKTFTGDMECFQKTAFKISESGAEGASVTAMISIEMGEGGFAPTPEIKLNRPFLYVVAEKSTGAIIFIGSVVKL